MNFSTVTFSLFGFKIYGVLVGLAFAVAAWRYYKKLQKHHLSIDFFVHHFWRWLLGGVALGRVVAVLEDSTIWDRNGVYSFFTFWDGNLNALGVLVGFLVVMWWDMRRSGCSKDFLRYLDLGIEPLLLGVMVADLAAFVTGYYYGTETALPWGVQYETFGVETINPVHPVSLYAFAVHFLLFQWARKHEKSMEGHRGDLAVYAGMLFFGLETVLQLFRGDNTYLVLGTIRVEQVLSFVFFVGLAWVWTTKRDRS